MKQKPVDALENLSLALKAKDKDYMPVGALHRSVWKELIVHRFQSRERSREVLYRRKGKPYRIRGEKYADRVRSSSFSGPHHEGRTQHKVNLKEVCSIVAPMSMPRSNDL